MTRIQIQDFPGPNGPLDLEFGDEVVRVTGPNGAGKTSFLRCIAGLPQHLGGRVTMPDGTRIGWVPQDARDALIGLVVAGEFRFRGIDGSVPGLMDRDVANLSSGQARRVAIELARSCDLLLLDEATEGLDEDRIEDLRRLIEGHAGPVFYADHDPRLADLAEQTIVLAEPAGAAPFEVSDAHGEPVVHVAASVVERDSGLLPLPEAEFGPGLHCIAGPNGCGKSTFLLRLAGLLDHEGVRIHGKDPQPGSNVRLLLPHARDHLHAETVEESLRGVADAHGLVPQSLLGRHPTTLSGGEAQRVALAKVLGQEAAVYLLDEPEAHLDSEGRAALARAISARIQEGACIIAATHDPHLMQASMGVLRWS